MAAVEPWRVEAHETFAALDRVEAIAAAAVDDALMFPCGKRFPTPAALLRTDAARYENSIPAGSDGRAKFGLRTRSKKTISPKRCRSARQLVEISARRALMEEQSPALTVPPPNGASQRCSFARSVYLVRQ